MSESAVDTAVEFTEGSVLEFVEFLLPKVKSAGLGCPAWPPDVFAVAASVLRRNGAYVHSVTQVTDETLSLPTKLGSDWPETARTIGEAWRKAVETTFNEEVGAEKKSFRAALPSVPVPPEVERAWSVFLRRAAVLPIPDSYRDRDLSHALLRLVAFADEASVGIGLPSAETMGESFMSAASTFLELAGGLSFCCTVDVQKARVLAKKHTPQQGLTLRSMTHHLSLCMPWEVNARWFQGNDRADDVLNLLLLPWPLKVDSKKFTLVGTSGNGGSGPGHRYFEYSGGSGMDDFATALNDAIDDAVKTVSRLHAVVFPELALTTAEWDVAQAIAYERSVMLIAGICDDRDAATKLPINSCRTLTASLQGVSTGPDPSEKVIEGRDKVLYRQYQGQAKHHRWCLDRNQILQYDLGGQLPSALRCWENSHVLQRGLFFASLGGWLTFTVLICEDLARQDPIAEVLRSVGPNLVVALLMDGPQLAARWPARYASVLADDPGSSVLTLTSLGMCVRSRRLDRPAEPPSRTIAMWKDKLYGVQEITLAEKSIGCVLSLSCQNKEEFTADGRSDGSMTQVPVFSGIYQVPGVAAAAADS
jgi:hypothetical protein